MIRDKGGTKSLSYIWNYYKKLSIKQKLLLLFSVQIIIPMIFMGTLLYKNAEHIIQNKCISYSADLMKMIELRLNDFSKELNNITEDIIYDQKIYTILNQTDLDYTITEEAKEDCYQSLRRICLSNRKLEKVILADVSGLELYSYDLHAGEVDVGEELPFSDMLEKARLDPWHSVWYMQSNTNGEVTPYLIRLIYNSDTFNERGMIILQVNQETLSEVYNDLSTEFMENLIIFSSDNQLINSTGKSKLTSDEAYWLSLQTDEWSYMIDTKSKKLTAYMSISDTPWKIIAKVSLNQLFNEDMDHFRITFILIMGCTTLLLSILSILMAIDIINPINRLVYSIKKFEEDNVHSEVLIDREDELGYLSKCFNKMSSQIDNLLNKVYKEQLTRKESELKALQAQINPHFLFNTLESINWMAQLNNVPEIRDMVTSLGTLMEASIGKGSPQVPLSKELKYVDSYLLIMKNRYGDRLSYENHIDKSLLHYEVPKLILQPLIENAIYHGVDKIRKKGIITLTLQRREENIYIEIMDNGQGMLPEEVENMNKGFKEDNHDYLLGTNRKSIGLANVNGRIKLLFGQDYGLIAESIYGQYTKIQLSIPIRNNFKGGMKNV